MSLRAVTSKGVATRDTIVTRAYRLACRTGLEGLSIGTLAGAVGMSKSGVFAHFGSREDLQLAVLDTAAEQFAAHVFEPALAVPRGLPRVRAIMAAWFDWAHTMRSKHSGCLLLGAVSEYDDRPGPLRNRVIQQQQRWRSTIARAVGHAIDAGELRGDTDADQLAFELYGVALVLHHDAGLFGYQVAAARSHSTIERLLASYSV